MDEMMKKKEVRMEEKLEMEEKEEMEEKDMSWGVEEEYEEVVEPEIIERRRSK